MRPARENSATKDVGLGLSSIEPYGWRARRNGSRKFRGVLSYGSDGADCLRLQKKIPPSCAPYTTPIVGGAPWIFLVNDGLLPPPQRLDHPRIGVVGLWRARFSFDCGNINRNDQM